MAKKKKSTKEELAKAKDELGKIKGEWQKLPKSGKIGTAAVGAVIVIVISAFIFGNNDSDNSASNATSGGTSNTESVSAAEEEIEEDTAGLPIDEYIVETDSRIEEATLNEDGILTILLNASSSLGPNSVATTHIYWSFEAMHEAFKDDSVEEVNVIIQALLIDNQGNEDYENVVTYAYTRDDFNELDYDNFLRLASGEEWRILNEAYAYFMHPAVHNEVDSDYQNSLSNGNSKVPLVEE